MSELPALNVSISDCITDSVEVRILANTALTPAALSLLDFGIKAFVEAGARGGYPVSSGAPEHSSLSLASGLTPDSSGCRFILEARKITRNCFQLLRHMLSKPELPACELQQIQVRDSSGHKAELLPEIDEDLEVDLYPAMADNLAFTLEYGDDVFSKSRRVEVEFSAPIGAPEIASFKPYAQAWGSLLEAGAFALPYDLPDVQESVMGQVTQFDSHSAEIEVPVYLVSEEGWNVLINILHTFSKRELAIVRVLLE